MKLKIMALAIAFVLLVPGLNAFAYEGGLLQGIVGKEVIAGNNRPAITDGDESTSTYVNTSARVRYELNKVQTITHYQVKAQDVVRIDFYDSDNSLISRTSDITNKLISVKTEITAVSNVKYVELVNLAGAARTIYEFDVFNEKPVIVYDPVIQVTESHTHDSVDLKWINPGNLAFEGVRILKNGVEIVDLDKSKNSYRINGLDIKTEYQFEIVSKYSDGEEGPSQKISVTTSSPPPVGEVIELEAEPTHERINLSWELPKSSFLKHINIYRDEIEDMVLLDKALGFTSVSAAATTKIFETNGTYFNDLTVKPETKYEYTLTTLDTLNRESEGVTKVVETLEEPAPEIVGGDFSTDPVSGDFIYTWKKPTTGQVKVKVDGKEYKTVDAADGKIVIPKEDMKYTKLGDPLVSVTPIGVNGKVGEEVKTPGTFDNISMPFTVREMMMAALALFGLVGGITLLFLAFKFVPKWLALLKSSNRNGRSTAIVAEGNGRRFQEANLMEASAAAVKTPRELKVAAEKTERIPKAPRIPRAPKEPRVRQREPRVSQREPRRRRGE